MITGTSVSLGGKKCLLVFDWAAQQRLANEIGGGWTAIVSDAIEGNDVAKLAKILEIGLDKHQPGEWSAEKILALSPPLQYVGTAIIQAVNIAYWGKSDGPKTERPTLAKRIQLATRILFATHSSWQDVMVSLQQIFGS
jgi:hypothetical protein